MALKGLTLDQVLEELLEWGVSLEGAQRIAPTLLPVLNEPRLLEELALTINTGRTLLH